MILGQVLSKQVPTEIAVEVSPHSVDVVGIVLRGVVLEEEFRCLNPIVMTFARFLASGPGEIGILRIKKRVAGGDLFDDLGAVLENICLDDFIEPTLLTRIHLGYGKALGREESLSVDCAVLPRVDVSGSFVRKNRHVSLRRGKGTHELSGFVFLVRQTFSPLNAPSLTSAGLAPQKLGVTEKIRPLTRVKLSDRWCPSKRHPQVPEASGFPKMETWYKDGSRMSRPSISKRICSRIMMVEASRCPR